MRLLWILLGIGALGCVDDQAATAFAECETVVALREAKCPVCTLMNAENCEIWKYSAAGASQGSCRGMRAPAEVEDFWGTCVHPVAEATCEGDPDDQPPLLPEACRLEYDQELNEAQEEAGVGP